MSGSSRIENLFTHPSHTPLVAPSILSADFADLAADCRGAIDAGGDLLHLDVMDGHFVPNLTMGPALCRSLHRAMPGVFLDVHLMVTDPAQYVQPFAEAGAHHITFHIEAEAEPAKLADTVRAAGMSAGLAVNPPTPVSMIEPFIEAFDLVLIMSVNPGFSGQSFIESVLDKAKTIAARLAPHQRLEIDGGVSQDTARSCREAGCDVLVAASAIFGSDDYGRAIAAIRGAEVDAERRLAEH